MENSESKPLGRTVRIRGDVVRALRMRKGWTAEKLSSRVGCSLRTIDNVEASKNVIPKTVAEIAEALGVEIGTLIEGPAGVPHPSQDSQADGSANRHRIDVSVNINPTPEDKDGTKRFPEIMREITSAVGTKEEVEVSGISKKDRINIHISISPDQLVQLVAVFCAGRLDFATFRSVDFRPDSFLEQLLQALAPEPGKSRLSREEQAIGKYFLNQAAHYRDDSVDALLDDGHMLKAIERSRRMAMVIPVVDYRGILTIYRNKGKHRRI